MKISLFSDWSEADLDAILSELQQLEKKEIKRQQNGTKGELFIRSIFTKVTLNLDEIVNHARC